MDASRCWAGALVGLFLATAVIAADAGTGSTGPVDPDTRATMLTYASFLNELSARRRRALYFANPQSLFDGVPVGYVNSGSGNLTFVRRDIVVAAPMPIVVGRVYDSRNRTDGDFGLGGFRLSLAERIDIVDDGLARYTTSAATRVMLRRDGAQFRLVPERPTNIEHIGFVAGGAIVVSGHNGIVRRFERYGSAYLLVSVRDPFGNGMSLDYDANRRLSRVAGDDGARVDIARDEAGRIVGVSDDAGRSVAYRYGHDGLLVSVIDLGGQLWQYEYTDDQRLAAALAPGAALDFALGWNPAGRVETALTDGVERRYRYGDTDAALPGMSLTRITDDAGRVLTLGHDSEGVTTYAGGPSGVVSRLTLDERRRVVGLDVDDTNVAWYRYDRGGRVISASQRHASDAVVEQSIRYDNAGSVTSVIDADGARRISVEYRQDGRRVDVTVGKGLRVHQFDERGLLTGLSVDDSARYDFARDSRGRIAAVTDASGRSAAFVWSADGPLAAVRYPDGKILDYSHSKAGLRESAVRPGGGSLNYFYTPAGSLYRLERITPDGVTETSNYQLEDDGRVRRLVRGNAIYRFDYAANDDLNAVTWADGTLSFAYDADDRFYRVQFNDEPPLEYLYGAHEADLRLRSDPFTGVAARGRIDADLSFDRYAEVVVDRSMATGYGPVAFDVATNRFRTVYENGVAIPGETDIAVLIRTRLLAPDRVSAAITAGTAAGYGKFNTPSNPLFVPPEYRGVNCFFCPPSLPFAVPHRGQSTDNADTIPLAMLAASLERCGVGEQEPPEDCTLDVSGLPPYLCDLQQAQIGATLLPSALNEQGITWSVQGSLVQVPVGDTGPTTGVRGDSPINSSGTVRASFRDSPQICHSATLSLPVRANEPLSYAQLINLDACPERQQDADSLHEIDGCSIPPFTTVIFPGNVQNPVGGQLNLPGTSTAFGAPQAPIPHGVAPMDLPCNRHDVCYQTCGQAQHGCDSAMLNDMQTLCAEVYPAACPYASGSAACNAYADERLVCHNVAQIVYAGLRQFGAGSWQQRQVQYCDCCPP